MLINRQTYNLIELDEVGSTNDYSKELIKSGCNRETLVVTKIQTSGRGRLSRRFVSSGDFGLWFTAVFFPRVKSQYLGMYGCIAALAVSDTIKKYYGIDADIKWPNDVEIRGKKVCGILPESGIMNDVIEWAIVGIGVNITPPDGGFGEELKEKATSLSDHSDLIIQKKDLLDDIASGFFSMCDDISKGDVERILGEMREKSSILGKNVSLYIPDNKEPIASGKAVDFGSMGELIILSEHGETLSFNYGEVSLRFSTFESR